MEVVAATTPTILQVLPLHLFSDNHHHHHSSIPLNKSTATTTSNSSSLGSKIELNSVNNSMSQGFHQGIINFSNGFNRSATTLHRQDQQMAADQPSSSQRDINRFRVQGYEQQPTIAAAAPMGSLEEDQSSTSHHHHHQQIPVGYETGAGMLSEMFNYQSIPTTASTDMLEEQNQMSMNYRLLGRPGSSSPAAMQLFQMNPQQRSPSPPPPQHQHQQHLQGFHLSTAPAAEEVTFDGNPISVSQFMTWVPGNNSNVEAVNSSAATTSKIGGLSLSLSSLQHLEAAKQEEFRMGDGGFFYYNQQLENLGSHHHPPHQQQQHQHLQPLRLQGLGHGNLLSSTSQQQHQLHGGFSSPSTVGVVNVLRNSKYMKPTQELLEEFCSVGSRGHHHLKNHKRLGRRNSNPNTNQVGGSGSGGGGDNIVGSSSSSKDVTPPLSAADRIEQQRKKVSLLSMLDEVDRRYNYYCEQMQMVVNTFDSVMGYGAATPYTTLAQKAMSGHFRCLKDAISTQLKQTSELLGDKEGTSGSGVTKGETPRLRILDQSLRQQRAFHQMGMMEQEAWRPQRGLPERSVTILRAWLFEHFLHPYPSDADKHLLARQTGLSRNQVSNWFINARVRLWKPMVEEMYQQESKEAEEMTATTATTDHDEREGSRDQYHQFHRVRNSNQQDYKKTTTNTTPPSQPTAAATTAAEATVIAAAGMRSEIDALENDPSSSSSSLNAININCSSETTNNIYTTSSTFHNNNDMPPSSSILNNNLQQQRMLGNDTRRNLHSGAGGNNSLVTHEYGSTSSSVLNAQHENMESTLIRFGTASGDVSLTLGLRHAGNLPTENRFSVRDFRG